MTNLEQLKRQKAAKLSEARALLDKAGTEKRAASPEELAQFDTLEGEARSIGETIAREERMQAAAMEQGSTPEAPPVSGAKPFRSLGEQLIAVRNFYTGRGTDNRLQEVRTTLGLNEAVPSEGGFLVQPDLAAELLTPMYETNEIPNRCRRIPVTAASNAFSMRTVDETSRANGSRWGGVQVYWEAEGDGTTATKPKFGKLEMKLEKLMGVCYATDEMLADAAQLGAVITQAFNEEIGFKLSDAIVRGDGAGKPLGILNSDALVTVAKETGQAADTVITENILKMWKSRGGRGWVWLYNQELEDQLSTLTLPIGTGGVEMKLFQEPTAGNRYGTIKGAPAIPVEVASAPGDVGDIILADLSQYLLIDKGGVQTAESIHVQFLTDQMTYRFTYRVNGQSALKNKVTPYKRTNANFYISPFVTLAAR